jgi:hypothetical protein
MGVYRVFRRPYDMLKEESQTDVVYVRDASSRRIHFVLKSMVFHIS